MNSKLKITTKHCLMLGILTLTASLTVSCANRGTKTASANNPYASNPYYSNPSTGGSSSTASSSGASQYPTYSDTEPYVPPVTPQTPATYPSYTGGSSNPYPSYSGGSSTPAPAPSANPSPGSYPSGGGYTGAGASTGGSSHTVAGGENLYRISLKYGTTVSAIQSANGLSSTTIHPGQVLRIP